MTKLKELGFIKRDPTKPRAIEILNYIEENKNELDKDIIGYMTKYVLKKDIRFLKVL